MEKKLSQLFDYQRFDPSSRLADLIRKTESRHKRELSDDELFYVNAAGETEIRKTPTFKKEDVF